jgi:hypothetical protein
VHGNSPYSFAHLKTTMTTDMTGSRALARATQRLGLVPDGTFADEGPLSERERSALGEITGKYVIQPSVKLGHSSEALDRIILSCAANDPKVARSYVVALRDGYLEDTRARMSEILYSTKEFFASEIQEAQDEIERIDERLRAGFEEFPGIDPTNTIAVGDRLEALRAQQAQAVQRKAQLEAQLAAREEFLLTEPEFFNPPAAELQSPAAPPQPQQAVIDPALERAIENAKTRLVELVTVRRMTMEHPEVVAVLKQVEALEDLRRTVAANVPEIEPAPLAAAAPPVDDAARRQWHAQRMRVEMELDSLRRQLAVATAQADEITAKVERFEGLHARLVSDSDELRRMRDRRTEVTAATAVWQSHLSKLDRILTAESGQRGTQFTLIEEPKSTATPTKPRLVSVFVVCWGLGVAAAALIIALAELFDRSFRSVGQVTRALGIPVLECVGVIQTPRERRRMFVSRLIWTPTLALLVLSLATTATLAYASIARPWIVTSAAQKVDRVLSSIGVATIDLPFGVDDEGAK